MRWITRSRSHAVVWSPLSLPRRHGPGGHRNLAGRARYNNFRTSTLTFSPDFAHFSAPRLLPRAVYYALLGAHADWGLIGAWNPMLRPIRGARFRPAGDPGGWTTTRWGHRVFNRGHQCLGAASCRAQDRARLLQLGGETGRDLVLAAMPRASRRRAASRGNGELIFWTVGPTVLGPRVGDLNGPMAGPVCAG